MQCMTSLQPAVAETAKDRESVTLVPNGQKDGVRRRHVSPGSSSGSVKKSSAKMSEDTVSPSRTAATRAGTVCKRDFHRSWGPRTPPRMNSVCPTDLLRFLVDTNNAAPTCYYEAASQNLGGDQRL